MGINIAPQHFRSNELSGDWGGFIWCKDLEIHWKFGGSRVHDGSRGLGTIEHPWPEPVERKARDPRRHRKCPIGRGEERLIMKI